MFFIPSKCPKNFPLFVLVFLIINHHLLRKTWHEPSSSTCQSFVVAQYHTFHKYLTTDTGAMFAKNRPCSLLMSIEQPSAVRAGHLLDLNLRLWSCMVGAMFAKNRQCILLISIVHIPSAAMGNYLSWILDCGQGSDTSLPYLGVLLNIIHLLSKRASEKLLRNSVPRNKSAASQSFSWKNEKLCYFCNQNKQFRESTGNILGYISCISLQTNWQRSQNYVSNIHLIWLYLFYFILYIA